MSCFNLELCYLLLIVNQANFQCLNNQVLQEPEARSLGGRVFGGITQRLAARLLQQVLRSSLTTVRSPTL